MYVPFPIFILSIFLLFQKLIIYINQDSPIILYFIHYYILKISSPICSLNVFRIIIKLTNDINVPVLPTPALNKIKHLPTMENYSLLI